jgi:hypothetical protein
MTQDAAKDSPWDLLDRRAIDDLVAKDGAERVLGALANDDPAPDARLLSMRDLAVAGNIMKLREETRTLQSWAERHGMRRLVNALVELDRVLDLPQRGQAILQAQALTRFMVLHVAEDLAAFKRAVSSV